MLNDEDRLKGGQATLAKYIRECPLCGHRTLDDSLIEIARAGGNKTKEKYGREHYVMMGRRGGRGNRKEKNGRSLSSDKVRD